MSASAQGKKVLSDGVPSAATSTDSTLGKLYNRATTPPDPCPIDDLTKAADELLKVENSDITKKLGFFGNISLGPSNGFSDFMRDMTKDVLGEVDSDASNKDKNTLTDMVSLAMTNSISGSGNAISTMGAVLPGIFENQAGNTLVPNMSVTGGGALNDISKQLRGKDGQQSGNFLGGFLNSQVKGAQDSAAGLLALTGLTIAKEPRNIFGVAQDAMANLGTLFIDKNQVLEDMDEIIDKILEKIQEVDKEWYSIDKKANIDVAIDRLRGADQNINRVKNALLKTSIFREADMEDAREKICEAADFLKRYKTGVDIDFDFDQLLDTPINHVRLISLLLELKSLTGIYETRQNFIDESRAAISQFNFDIQVEVTAGGGDTAPIVRKISQGQARLIAQVQQELRSVLAQMESANETRGSLDLMVLTKTWAIQLQVIKKMTELSGKNITDYLKFDTEGFKKEFEADVDFVEKLGLDLPEPSGLIGKLLDYHRLCLRKLSFDPDALLDFPDVGGDRDKAADKAEQLTAGLVTRIQALNVEIHELIKQEMNTTDTFQNRFAGKVGGYIGENLSKILKIQRMLKDAGFDRATDLLCSGNLSGFFDLVPQTLTKAGNFVEKLNCALAGGLRTADGNGTSFKQTSDLLRVKRFATNKSRAQASGKRNFLSAFTAQSQEASERLAESKKVKASVDAIKQDADTVDREVSLAPPSLNPGGEV